MCVRVWVCARLSFWHAVKLASSRSRIFYDLFEDSVAHWGIFNCNQLLDSEWQSELDLSDLSERCFELLATWACADLHQWLLSWHMLTDSAWTWETFIPMWNFSAQAHFSASFCEQRASDLTPRTRHGPVRPETDPPTRQFLSELDSWGCPLVSVFWDDWHQTPVTSCWWTRKCRMLLLGKSAPAVWKYPENSLDLPECS